MIMRLESGKTTFPGRWFPTAVRIRLSQPPAGDWLAGAWAELGKKWIFEQFPVFLAAMSNSKRDN